MFSRLLIKPMVFVNSHSLDLYFALLYFQSIKNNLASCWHYKKIARFLWTVSSEIRRNKPFPMKKSLVLSVRKKNLSNFLTNFLRNSDEQISDEILKKFRQTFYEYISDEITTNIIHRKFCKLFFFLIKQILFKYNI